MDGVMIKTEFSGEKLSFFYLTKMGVNVCAAKDDDVPFSVVCSALMSRWKKSLMTVLFINLSLSLTLC
jgi:hypothetical protein